MPILTIILTCAEALLALLAIIAVFAAITARHVQPGNTGTETTKAAVLILAWTAYAVACWALFDISTPMRHIITMAVASTLLAADTHDTAGKTRAWTERAVERIRERAHEHKTAKTAGDTGAAGDRDGAGRTDVEPATLDDFRHTPPMPPAPPENPFIAPVAAVSDAETVTMPIVNHVDGRRG